MPESENGSHTQLKMEKAANLQHGRRVCALFALKLASRISFSLPAVYSVCPTVLLNCFSVKVEFRKVETSFTFRMS